MLRPALTVAAVVLGVGVGGIVAAGLGFVGLVLLLVFTFLGSLTSGLGPRRAYHVLYAETFAVWLILFLGLSRLAAQAPWPAAQMPLVVAAFLGSLLALGYPVLRGVPWRIVRQDVGLTLGNRPMLEPMFGVGAYLVTLPLLGAGMAITLGIMAIQGALQADLPTFAPAGPPAHPIVLEVSGGDAWLKVQVLLLASVVAPIVEETMFRGVLYRHLRDLSRGLGLVASVLFSAAAGAFLFAAIHPQGLVAVPVLMALACGMTLIREWRGTLIPSMVVHGVSNGVVMLLLIIVFGV